MLEVKYTNKMKRDVKLMRKRGKDMDKLQDIVDLLMERIPLPEKHRDHQLTGNLKDFRECHIEPDWLLMYQVLEDTLILSLTATGSHADLFE